MGSNPGIACTERTGLARAYVCTHSIVILVTLVYFSFTGFFGIERIKNFRASKWPSARQQFVQVWKNWETCHHPHLWFDQASHVCGTVVLSMGRLFKRHYALEHFVGIVCKFCFMADSETWRGRVFGFFWRRLRTLHASQQTLCSVFILTISNWNNSQEMAFSFISWI